MTASRGAPTILIVEDEFASLEVLAMLFESKGYRALMAADGQAALDCLLSEPVDLVLTDYMMPRLNGVMLCNEMQRNDTLRHIPVILMSANRFEEVGPAPRIVAFFGKPLVFDAVLASVRKTIGPPG